LSAVYFLYAEGKKARAFPEKHFVSGAGFKRSFWNLERVLQAEAGLLVEGELDVCALVEAGVPVTEILGAHGAKDKPIEGDPIEQPGYAYVVQALPWPIADIYRLSELPEPAPMALWQPGFEEWDRKVILAPRTLSVVTGHPGHGKTTLWNQIWFSVVDR